MPGAAEMVGLAGAPELEEQDGSAGVVESEELADTM